MRALTSIVAIALVAGALAARAAAQQGAPGQPTNVTAVVSGQMLTIAWTAPPGSPAPTSYRLDFFVVATGGLAASVPVGPGTSVTVAIPAGISGMFSVTVTALAGTIAGPPSAPATFTIGGTCTAPAAPTSLRFTGSPVDVTLIWDPVIGASDYWLEAGATLGGSEYFAGSVGSATSFAAGVRSDVVVFVRVRARNRCGMSAASNEINLAINPFQPLSIHFRPRLTGIDVRPCQPVLGPRWCSTAVRPNHDGVFDVRANPGDVIIRMQGRATATTFSSTFSCLNGAATGSISATWDGTRWAGTATLGNSTAQAFIYPGHIDGCFGGPESERDR